MDGPGTTPMSTAGPQSGSSQPNDDSREDANQRKANVRKRTKTGCLTCRKRRIKCDEAKPTCKNCIKSRRHCDGYNQRVIFKEPIGSLSAPFGPNAFSIGSSHLPDDSLSNQQAGQPSRVPLQAIAPRPPSFDFNHPLHIPLHQENITFQLPFHETQLVDMPLFHKLSSGAFLPPTYPQIQNPLLVSDIQPLLPCQPNRPKPTPAFSVLPPEDEIASEEPSAMAILDNAMVLYRQPSSMHHNEGHLQDELASRHFMSENLDTGQRCSSRIIARDTVPVTLNSTSHSHPLAHVLVPDETDEDRSMPDSDDDYQDAQEIVAPAMTASAHHRSATEMRTFGAYAGTWAVSAYLDHPNVPEFWHSGLRDIFTHFIHVTGPAIMLYEPLAFDQDPRHAELVAGHALWRSTFPQMALRHPALLQAMLALGSLQLAKLQNYTLAAALKHYHLALRRIGKIMQSDLRRKHPATLAATMMLGYFEVWAADHSKWSQHLWGARVLLQEIPLKEMARHCLPAKRWRQLSQQRRQMNHFFPGLMSGPQPSSMILDYELLSILTGTAVTSEDYGDVTPAQWDPSCFAASDKDVDNFEIYSDLFWWYCKMDVYQSFLAGTKLFMEFEHWTQCPPRASASNAGTPFGTFDHLVLLLGRLANFAFKDRSRKRKLAKSRAGGAAGGSPPMFPGMLPIQGKIRPPIGLDIPRETSPQSDSNEEFDVQGSIQKALQEWESIRQAFHVFREHLGPEFGKLDSEYGDLPDTPFGSAVQYRSYAIAGIWMNYYMGMINLFRSHPEMPQASLQAAGLQAAKTRDYALEIGRIAAGTVLDLSGVTEINTFLAAVLIESCFCLFVAGVQVRFQANPPIDMMPTIWTRGQSILTGDQFRDAAQRQWTIQRMYDVSRLTGWQSARQVAAGCESAWIKAYEMSVGPPYARTSLFTFKSVWDNPRQIDTKIRELVPGEDEPIVLANSDRANYALGLLSVEEDLKVLELED